MEIRFETVKVNPQIAAEYLRKNTKNPRGTILNKARVKQYAHDMAAGLWELNGEAIVFDEDGMLKNGAHRLAAVILANAEVEMVVAYGVGRNVTAWDMPYVRNMTHLANSEDISVSKEALCAVKTLYGLMPGKVATQMEIKRYAKDHESDLNRAYRSLLNGSHTRFSKRASGVLAAYLMLQTQKMPFYEVELFFRVFSSGDINGTDGYETSPAMIARKMFMERWEGRAACQRVQKEQLDVLIQAMNDFHGGKERKTNYKISQPFSFEPLLKAMEVV